MNYPASNASDYVVERKVNSHDALDSRYITISSATFDEDSGNARETDSAAQSVKDENGNFLDCTADSTGVRPERRGIIGFAHCGLLTDILRDDWGLRGTVVTDRYSFNFI